MALFDVPTLDPIMRGDYERIGFQIMRKDNPELPQDITGWTLKFGAKTDLSDSTVLIQKDSNVPGHFEITDPSAGVGDIIIQPADTAGITYAQTLICDIQATNTEGQPSTTRFYLPVELDVSG